MHIESYSKSTTRRQSRQLLLLKALQNLQNACNKGESAHLNLWDFYTQAIKVRVLIKKLCEIYYAYAINVRVQIESFVKSTTRMQSR